MSAPDHDSRQPPWYRQFWPWFLILLPATVVVASLWTLYIASSGSDDLVVDEYYKDGLAINRQLEKKQRATDLGLTATVTINGDRVTVLLSGPVEAEQLTLRLSHPLEADRDFALKLMRASPGRYRARLPELPAPRWHWTLLAGEDSRWRLDGDLDAGHFDHAPEQ